MRYSLPRRALLSLHLGLEKLYSLEALDVSFNLVSEINETNRLAELPLLESLSLRGNPMCDRPPSKAADAVASIASTVSGKDKEFGGGALAGPGAANEGNGQGEREGDVRVHVFAQFGDRARELRIDGEGMLSREMVRIDSLGTPPRRCTAIFSFILTLNACSVGDVGCGQREAGSSKGHQGSHKGCCCGTS
jgi:hypothetical protein